MMLATKEIFQPYKLATMIFDFVEKSYFGQIEMTENEQIPNIIWQAMPEGDLAENKIK